MKIPKDLVEWVEIILGDLRRGDIDRKQANGFIVNAVAKMSKSDKKEGKK